MRYRPSLGSDEFRRNNHHYYIPNQDGKVVVYTYIRKNACSAFKAYTAEFCRLNGLPSRESLRATFPNKADYTLFIYRDPFERAVSTFVNKFLDLRGNSDIVENYRILKGDPSLATFSDFVDYIYYDFSIIDPHLWPQKSHLAEVHYTHAINMYRLGQEMSQLLPSISHHFGTPKNASKYSYVKESDLSHTPALELHGLSVTSDNFENMRERIECRYKVDMEMISSLEN